MITEITIQLAQSGASPGSRGGVFSITIGIILIAVLGVGAIAGVFALKKRVFRDDDPSGSGFSLGELRRLRDQGELTEEQYEQARSAIISAQHGGTNEIRQLREQRQRQSDAPPPHKSDL